MPSYKLKYFDGTGRAEPIRIALTAAGVQWEDARFGYADWASIKPTTPLGQVPVLEFDGMQICQALPILKYAGKLAKIYPEDAFVALKVDEMHGCINDLTAQFYAVFFNPDAEAKAALAEKFTTEQLPFWASSVEKMLLSRGQTDYFVGTSLTTADLEFWNVHNYITRDAAKNDPLIEKIAEEFKKCPTVEKIVKNVGDHEIVKAYYAGLKTSKTPTLKLKYMDIKGRAEPIRITLSAAKDVEWEDVRFGYPEWPAIKPTTPMGQAPVLEVDGLQICQSRAILKYAGKLAKLYPEDELSALKVDEMQGMVTDLADQFSAFFYNKTEARAAMAEKFLGEQLPFWASSVEKMLASRGQTDYTVGTSLTTADLEFWNAYNHFTRDAAENDPLLEKIAEELKKYPTLEKIKNNVDDHEIVKAYYASKSA